MNQITATKGPEIASGIPRSIKYRADIDGLRALAILSVVLYHAFPLVLKGGFVGVDIFFVISGFLISSIVFKEADEGRYSHARFYVRRIKRIFPALSVVLFTCLLLGGLFSFKQEFKSIGKHIIAGSAFMSNFVLSREGGYFDTWGESNPLRHLWALSIIEQFYIFWPLLIIAVWKIPKKHVISLFISLTALSFFANIYLVRSDPTEAFYLPLSRFWELSAGALLAFATHFRITYQGQLAVAKSPPVKWITINTWWNIPATYSHWISILGIFAIIISLFEKKSDSFPGWIALLPTLGTVALIGAGPNAIVNKHILSTRIAILIGLISYPLYLWHWPLLVFTRQVFQADNKYIVTLAAIGAAIILSVLTFRFIETPVRTSKSVHFLPVALSMSIILAAISGVLAYKNILPVRLDSGIAGDYMSSAEDWDYPSGKMDNFKKEGCFNLNKIAGLPENKVLFIGDSYIEQYWPRIEVYAKEMGHNFPETAFATDRGCPPLPKVNRTESGFSCDKFFEYASQIALSGEYQTIVFGAFWESYFGYQYQNAGDPTVYRTDDIMKKSLNINSTRAARTFDEFSELIKKLTSKKEKVYIILSTPSSPFFDPKEMIDRLTGLDRHHDISKSSFIMETSPVTSALVTSVMFSGATILSPLGDLCHGDQCQSIGHDGLPIYRDCCHIRASYARNELHFLDVIYIRENREPLPRHP
jgi:peptidoglycan/LPS O-acetylase OafA/YrhL